MEKFYSLIYAKVDEIRRVFRLLNSVQDCNKAYDLPLQPIAFNCGLYAFDWKFFIAVRTSLI